MRCRPTSIWPFVDRLAARIASFPPHAVREAKASVLSVEKSIEDDLLAEAAAFNRTLGDPRAQQAMSAVHGHGRPDAGRSSCASASWPASSVSPAD